MQQYEDIITNKRIYVTVYGSSIDIVTFINWYKSEALDNYIYYSVLSANIIATSFDQFKIIFNYQYSR